MNNVYRRISAERCSKEERRQSETQVCLQNLDQKMLSNKDWLVFFHNIKNKRCLLGLFVIYLCKSPYQLSSPLPILATNKNEIFKISSSVTKVF